MAHAAEMVRVLKDRYTNLTFTGHEGALGLTIETESSDEKAADHVVVQEVVVVHGVQGLTVSPQKSGVCLQKQLSQYGVA